MPFKDQQDWGLEQDVLQRLGDVGRADLASTVADRGANFSLGNDDTTGLYTKQANAVNNANMGDDDNGNGKDSDAGTGIGSGGKGQGQRQGQASTDEYGAYQQTAPTRKNSADLDSYFYGHQGNATGSMNDVDLGSDSNRQAQQESRSISESPGQSDQHQQRGSTIAGIQPNEQILSATPRQYNEQNANSSDMPRSSILQRVNIFSTENASNRVVPPSASTHVNSSYKDIFLKPRQDMIQRPIQEISDQSHQPAYATHNM